MFTIEFKTKIVEKLIDQYQLYVDLLGQIKSEKFKSLKDTNLGSQIRNMETILERWGDEMSFPLPSIWMMYKYEAYKNTDKEIKIVEDFVDHCSPDGYICTERFKFINKFLPEDFWSNLKDDLLKYTNHAEIIKLENDPKFTETWLANEFRIIDNKINKWK